MTIGDFLCTVGGWIGRLVDYGHDLARRFR